MTNTRMNGVAVMKRTNQKRMLAMGIIASIIMVMFAPYISEGIIARAEGNQALVSELIAEREDAILNNDENRVEEINEQLSDLGVEQLTTEQVMSRMSGTNLVMPRIETPTNSDTITWDSCRYVAAYGGVTYELQYLYATPRGEGSKLFHDDDFDIVLNAPFDWESAVVNLLKLAAAEYASSIGDPRLQALVLAYDIIEAINDASPQEIVIQEGDVIHCGWTYRNTVQLVYVKELLQTDDEQQLTFIATRGILEIGYFWKVIRDYQTDFPSVKTTHNFVSENYNLSMRNILKLYVGETGGNRSYIRKVDIYVNTNMASGGEEEWEKAQSFYPLTPDNLAHIII